MLFSLGFRERVLDCPKWGADRPCHRPLQRTSHAISSVVSLLEPHVRRLGRSYGCHSRRYRYMLNTLVDLLMPRPMNPDLSKNWKIMLPATLAGRVEHALVDAVHSKPIYGARAKLITALLEDWLARESGSPRGHVPSISELRTMGER